MSLKEIKDTVALFDPSVKNNAKIAHCKDFPLPIAFHITIPPVPNPFWPRMPHSAANSENNTVPRVIAASTLVGCMNGATYIVSRTTNREGGLTDCGNYYHILGFDFEYCLLPNKELVFDAEDNEEQWLICYNKDTRNYRHRQMGEFFVQSINQDMRPNSKVNKMVGIVYLHVMKDPGLAVTKNKIVTKGWYKLQIDLTRYYGIKVKRMRYDEDDLVQTTEISEELYNSYRKLHVKKGF